MSTSLAQLLTETAAAHADRPALKLDDTVVNYAVLNEGATRIAGLLKEKGIEPGDRVGIMLPERPVLRAVYYGILRAGGVVVPMNVLLKGREVAFYLKDSGAKIVFAWHDFGEAAPTGAEEAGTEAIMVEPGEFEQLVMERAAGGGGRAARGRRHRRDPLHDAARPARPRAPSSRTRTCARTAR